MVLRNRLKWFYLLLFLSVMSVSIKAQNVNVVITGIRSTDGQIIIGVYKDEKSFKDDVPFERKRFKKSNISNGEMKVNMKLSPGTYGFALLDDENLDDEMNYSFIGIPKEGFGFSNYYHTNLSRPKFDVFKFEIQDSQVKNVVCKIKYM